MIPNNWEDLRRTKALAGAIVVAVVFFSVLIIGAFIKPPEDKPAPVERLSTKPPAPATEPEPTSAPTFVVPRVGPQVYVPHVPHQEQATDENVEPETENVDSEIENSESQNSPCECTPTCPCDANHCVCRGKQRCSEACPCHKQIAKFYCPKCKRNGYCDYDPDVPEQSRPHRVCRDCKLWMDRVEPPMSAQEGYDVVVWRRVQVKMQAEARAKAEAAKQAKAEAKAEAERRKQRSSMPVYDPFDEDMPSWRGRRFYFNSNVLPAAGCKT